MNVMNPISLIHMQDRRERARRVSQATAAQRRLRTVERAHRIAARNGGRAWINGAQTAEPDPALDHLAEFYD
ncbi:MAG: hypothetical protein QOC86_2971 [Gaiellales bacterium]|jgi:hypothetical protein|nr:hypothetical protein [Gaiellales bacterium]MEA2403801.1 hypothetical protein [Thermoleophilaceae bacterium]